MIRLVEYQTTRLVLTPPEVAALVPLVRGSLDNDGEDTRILQAMTPTSEKNTFDIRSGPYVGRLGLPGGRWIDFESRFPIEDVLYLILQADQPAARLVRPELVEGSATPFFVDLLASRYLDETERLVRAGIHKGYVVRRHLRPPYGGSLDTTYHLSRLGGRPDTLVTTSRKLTTGTWVNSVLAAALDLLRLIPLPARLSRQAAGLLPAFARVDRAGARGPQRERVVVPPRYRPALELAFLLLKAQTLGPRGDGASVPSILFFMPAVWEAYVARWLRRSQPQWRIEAGHRFTLASSGVWARADAVAWGGSTRDRLTALYDAKYKWANDAPKAADLYQMVTYATALGLGEATLVYPVATEPRTVRVGDKRVHVLGLPPRADEMGRSGWNLLRVRDP